MRARLAFVSLFSTLVFACGGTDDSGLFSGSDAGIGGGTSGGTSGTGATGGTSGAATGGGGTGGGVTGGSPGSGGANTGGAATGGAPGTGGATGGGPATGGTPGTGGVGAGGVGTGGAGTGGVVGIGGASSGGTGGVTTGPSCVGKCGSTQGQPLPAGGQCFCDAVCIGMGDCCPNWSAVCNAFVGKEVNCGDNKCKTANEYCCQQYSSSSDAYTPKCQSKSDSCAGPHIFCDDPSDCGAGQVCCGSLNGSGNFIAIATCRGSGDCRADQERVVFCGGSPSVCPSGKKCESMSFLAKYNLPQYNVCQ